MSNTSTAPLRTQLTICLQGEDLPDYEQPFYE